MKSEVDEITDLIIAFRNERDWEQFHDAKNLAINLSIESSELLQNFLWKQSTEANVASIKEELADVFYSAFLLADLYKFDVKQIIEDKLASNARKYPVEKSKGSNKKYTNL